MQAAGDGDAKPTADVLPEQRPLMTGQERPVQPRQHYYCFQRAMAWQFKSMYPNSPFYLAEFNAFTGAKWRAMSAEVKLQFTSAQAIPALLLENGLDMVPSSEVVKSEAISMKSEEIYAEMLSGSDSSIDVTSVMTSEKVAEFMPIATSVGTAVTSSGISMTCESGIGPDSSKTARLKSYAEVKSEAVPMTSDLVSMTSQSADGGRRVPGECSFCWLKSMLAERKVGWTPSSGTGVTTADLTKLLLRQDDMSDDEMKDELAHYSMTEVRDWLIFHNLPIYGNKTELCLRALVATMTREKIVETLGLPLEDVLAFKRPHLFKELEKSRPAFTSSPIRQRKKSLVLCARDPYHNSDEMPGSSKPAKVKKEPKTEETGIKMEVEENQTEKKENQQKKKKKRVAEDAPAPKAAKIKKTKGEWFKRPEMKCQKCDTQVAWSDEENHRKWCWYADDGESDMFVLEARGFQGVMRLVLALPVTASFEHLRLAMLDIWMACCGHCSKFIYDPKLGKDKIPDNRSLTPSQVTVTETMIDPDQKDRIQHDMKFPLSEACQEDGTCMIMEYDMGTPTIAMLRFEGRRRLQLPLPASKRHLLLMRNVPPQIPCIGCDKPSKFVHNCGTGLDDAYKTDFFCSKKCYDRHRPGEPEMRMRLANSPRSGACGYYSERWCNYMGLEFEK